MSSSDSVNICHRIKDKDFLIVKSADDNSSYNILQVNGEQKLGKYRVHLKDIIEQPYGAYFELNGRKFTRIDDVKDTADNTSSEKDMNGTEEFKPSEETSSNLVPTETQLNNFTNTDIERYLSSILEKNAEANAIRGDNSKYVDTNTAQKLKDSDIVKLREQGLSGSEIIKTLIQHSDTFGIKSDFAQEKWIKRKEKKYVKRYQVLPCTPATICEASFRKNKDKVSNLRYETFAQLLSQSGVYSGCHVLVVESMVGMVIGALAYRMRGDGRILAMYGGQQPHFDMVRCYNLSSECHGIIEPIPSLELGPAAKDVCLNGFLPYQEFELPEYPLVHDKPASSSSAPAAAATGSDENPSGEAVPVFTAEEIGQMTCRERKKYKKRKLIPDVKDQISSTGRAPAAQERTRSYLRQGVNRLIIASRFRPLPILKQALYLLQPSSPFVIFHEFFEPLVDCYLYLQESGLAIRLILSDSWLREFQTLPGRMRPEMFMTTSGGYLLSGIYVGMVPCKYPFSVTSADTNNSHEQVMDEEK